MRVVHYLNQFFAGLGGEDRADTAPLVRTGPVGPGVALQRALGAGADIVGTVICGDGRFADRMEETAAEVLALIGEFAPDVVVAGPAFNAGRYGLACGRVCLDVARVLSRPSVTGMHPENAAVEVYGRDVLIVPTSASAMGMGDAVTALARLATKLGRGEPPGPAAVDGYLPRGRRVNARVGRAASERAIDLLLARLRGDRFTTEVPLPVYDRVPPPAPLGDLARSRLALVTECGLVPRGNPDRLEWVRASKWLRYDLPDGDGMHAGAFEVIHGGYDSAFALADPNRLVPLDAVRALERAGEIGSVLPAYYVTCGNHGILSQMTRYAQEIAEDLRRRDVDAILLVAT